MPDFPNLHESVRQDINKTKINEKKRFSWVSNWTLVLELIFKTFFSLTNYGILRDQNVKMSLALLVSSRSYKKRWWQKLKTKQRDATLQLIGWDLKWALKSYIDTTGNRISRKLSYWTLLKDVSPFVNLCVLSVIYKMSADILPGSADVIYNQRHNLVVVFNEITNQWDMFEKVLLLKEN